eukprot:94610_1
MNKDYSSHLPTLPQLNIPLHTDYDPIHYQHHYSTNSFGITTSPIISPQFNSNTMPLPPFIDTIPIQYNHPISPSPQSMFNPNPNNIQISDINDIISESSSTNSHSSHDTNDLNSINNNLIHSQFYQTEQEYHTIFQPHDHKLMINENRIIINDNRINNNHNNYNINNDND